MSGPESLRPDGQGSWSRKGWLAEGGILTSSFEGEWAGAARQGEGWEQGGSTVPSPEWAKQHGVRRVSQVQCFWPLKSNVGSGPWRGKNAGGARSTGGSQRRAGQRSCGTRFAF